MTHPFHPLYGREFELVERRCPWGDAWTYFFDERGELRRVRTAWTDLVEADPWVVVAAGRSPFRLEDLIELGDLIDSRKT